MQKEKNIMSFDVNGYLFTINWPVLYFPFPFSLILLNLLIFKTCEQNIPVFLIFLFLGRLLNLLEELHFSCDQSVLFVSKS